MPLMMEIRLTLDDPEKAFVRRQMFEREESARAYTLHLIQEAMKKSAKDAPSRIRSERKK